MSESLLYFIWQYQYFDVTALVTTGGEPVQIINSGFRNTNAGPDFLNARLIINGVEWAGTVEIHTKASDWLTHRHQNDKFYDNVILHVVWDNDKVIMRTDGSALPTLELKHRIDTTLLERYQQLSDSAETIPCGSQFRRINSLRLTAMLDKALMQRLERKANTVQSIFEATGQNWEETTYRLLAVNLGFKINAQPLEQLSRAVPLKVLLKHRNSQLQIEAILFGTAGLLEGQDPSDSYVNDLQREYRFLGAKYGLYERQLATHVWKWARLRPANFPTLRLAQLAKLIANYPSLFSLLLGSDDAALLSQSLQMAPSAYWQMHYRFGKATEKAVSNMGVSSAENVLINTAVPLLAAYAHHRGQPEFTERAITLLEQLSAEKNHIIDTWAELGLSVHTAFDSQAALELYNEFCLKKQCLNCQIGTALVRPAAPNSDAPSIVRESMVQDYATIL